MAAATKACTEMQQEALQFSSLVRCSLQTGYCACLWVRMRTAQEWLRECIAYLVAAFIIRLVFFFFLLFVFSFIRSSCAKRNSSFDGDCTWLSSAMPMHTDCETSHAIHESRICQWAMGTDERIEGAPELQLYQYQCVVHSFVDQMANTR